MVLVADLEFVVVAVGDPDDHGRVAARQCGGVELGVVEGLHRALQQEPLLGVHPGCFLGGDAEVVGVESADVVEERAGGGVRLALVLRVLVEEPLGIEAFGRYRREDILARVQGAPQVLAAVDGSRHAKAQPDDGDRVLRFGGTGRVLGGHRRFTTGRGTAAVLPDGMRGHRILLAGQMFT